MRSGPMGTPQNYSGIGWGHEHKNLKYLKNGARHDQDYYDAGGLIGSRILAFDWYRNQ